MSKEALRAGLSNGELVLEDKLIGLKCLCLNFLMIRKLSAIGRFGLRVPINDLKFLFLIFFNALLDLEYEFLTVNRFSLDGSSLKVLRELRLLLMRAVHSSSHHATLNCLCFSPELWTGPLGVFYRPHELLIHRWGRWIDLEKVQRLCERYLN